MARQHSQAIPKRRTTSTSFWDKLKELDMFFQGTDPVHQTMRRVARRLERAGIPYAVVGGMAVFFHKHRRATNDVDVLLTPEGFAEFRKRFVRKNYDTIAGRPRRFVDRTSDVTLDILVTGHYPGSGRPGPIVYPDPAAVRETIEKVQFLNLVTLVQLKLAARRHQDFADVVNLIAANDLDESFAGHIHSSVRGDYSECLEEKRREDEYEARQDRAVEEMLRKDEHEAREAES
jgi:hypothetical protein